MASLRDIRWKIVSCLGLTLICSIAIADNEKIASSKEDFVCAVAIDYNQPDLCERIAGDSMMPKEGFGGAYAIGYLKSYCYYTIVENYGDSSLCDKVIEAHNPNPLPPPYTLDGSGYSPGNCKKLGASVGKMHYSGPIPPDAIAQIMQELGYDSNQVVDTVGHYSKPLPDDQAMQAYMGYYSYLKFSKDASVRDDFLRRVRNMKI